MSFNSILLRLWLLGTVGALAACTASAPPVLEAPGEQLASSREVPVAGPTTPAPTTTPEQAQLYIAEQVRQLENEDRLERTEAAHALQEDRRTLIRELIELLQNSRAATSEEDSTIHLAMVVLGEWRATEATKVLLDKVDLKLDVQAGAKRAPGYEYPAAQALINIGGTEVLNAVIARIGEDPSPTRRQLLTWVVYQLVGSDVGSMYLEAVPADADAHQARRVDDARRMVRQGNQLLRMLEEGAGADSGD